MTYTVKTISYFTIWGLFYGVVLGAFSGTAILPYFGTLYSTVWGAGIGIACGILSGVVAAVIRARSFNHDTDLDRLRRNMALGLGALIAIAAPVLLLGSTRGFLWGSGMMRDMLPWTALSLLSASFWGGLSSAYIASHYPTYIARLTARREYDESEVDLPQAKRDISIALRTLMRAGLTRWVFLLGAIAGGFISLVNASSFISGYSGLALNPGQAVAYVGIGGVLGLIATFFVGLYVSFGNAALLTFLKRLIFREYFPHMPPRWYHWTLTITAFVFTGAVTVWSIIFAPLIAFITAFVVYRTLALPDETIDKTKRKEKNALALEDDIDEDDEMFLVEDNRLLDDILEKKL